MAGYPANGYPVQYILNVFFQIQRSFPYFCSRLASALFHLKLTNSACNGGRIRDWSEVFKISRDREPRGLSLLSVRYWRRYFVRESCSSADLTKLYRTYAYKLSNLVTGELVSWPTECYLRTGIKVTQGAHCEGCRGGGLESSATWTANSPPLPSHDLYKCQFQTSLMCWGILGHRPSLTTSRSPATPAFCYLLTTIRSPVSLPAESRSSLCILRLICKCNFSWYLPASVVIVVCLICMPWRLCVFMDSCKCC